MRFAVVRFSLLLGFWLNSVTLVLSQQKDVAGWFAFRPQNNGKASAIDMSNWLDAPAGKHGYVQLQKGSFVFKDGTPVKFWGVNICSDRPYIPQDEVPEWVNFLAKYGINGVRFHKFTSHGLTGNTSTQLDARLLDNFDYFQNALRQKGIYYGWSHIYGHKPKPGDKSRLLAYDELAAVKLPWSHLNGASSGLVNFAEDLQDLNIELTVNMLQHKNPYSGLRYADDPALNFVELQNEDNIFWGAIENTLEQTPAYRALLCRKFSGWLKQKYKTQEALIKAWGANALPAGEALAKENIYPKPSHSWFQAEFTRAEKENRPVQQHYLDKAQFLYETQMAFYNRFVQAIRKTGYQGPIVGSCWQAGTGITHFYNLYSDYQTGIVDRHNYFGGGSGHHMQPGKFTNEAMVSRPGSGLLSTGLQLVANRPFAISEWMALIPTEWVAEAAPIMATYGMGLQGWDASYSFAVDYPDFTATIHTPGIYNVTSPTQLTLYPALAAMVYRGDVKEGQTVATRNVHLPSLTAGKLGFFEQVNQSYDVKSFAAIVPNEALAIGPVEVAFTDTFQKTEIPDLRKFWNQAEKVITSNTGQLQWNYQDKGYISVNTPGTQGVVGFTGGKTQQLEALNLRVQTPFAVVLVSSLDKKQPVSKANRLLITTMARARNTGMQYNATKTELQAVGQAPILLEPVKVSFSLNRSGQPKIYILDHAGQRTGQMVNASGKNILLDGSATHAIYYEVVFE